MPRKPFKLFLLVASVLALALLLFNWFGRTEPVTVVVKPVGFGLVRTTVANTRAGTIKACRRAGISPSIGGQIASMPVKEGDLVKPGQLLMEFWNRDQR